MTIKMFYKSHEVNWSITSNFQIISMGDLEIFNLFQDNFDGNQPLLEWEAQIENYFDLVSLPLNVRNIKVVLFVGATTYSALCHGI